MWTLLKRKHVPQPLKALLPSSQEDYRDGIEYETEKASTEVFYTKISFIFNLHLALIRPQLVLEEDKMQTDSLKVRQ